MSNATITTTGTRPMVVLTKGSRDAVLDAMLAADPVLAAAYAAKQQEMLSVTTEHNGVTYTTSEALIAMNRIHMEGLNLRKANKIAYETRTLADELGSKVRAELESGYIDLALAMESGNKVDAEAPAGLMGYPVSPDQFEIYAHLTQFLKSNNVARNYLSREVAAVAKEQGKTVK